MNNRTLTIRFISVFVIAFICLNGAGALCVAYCQTSEFAKADVKEHCPMSEGSIHHTTGSEDKNSPSFSFNTDELDCCPLTVTFVSAPLEAKNQLRPAWLAAAAVVSAQTIWGEARRTYLFDAVSYRGPPLDQRVDRLKHCVLRI